MTTTFIDNKCIEQTQNSRLKALRKLLNVIGVLPTNSFNADSFVCANDYQQPNLSNCIKNMCMVYATTPTLIECGYSLVTKTNNIWRNNFLTVKGKIAYPYNAFYKHQEIVESADNAIKICGLKYNVNHIVYIFNIGQWGLSQWNTHKAEIDIALYDAPKLVRESYYKQLKDANKQVMEWSKVVDPPAIEIPI